MSMDVSIQANLTINNAHKATTMMDHRHVVDAIVGLSMCVETLITYDD
jgi:hypothetical protein